MKCLVSQFTEQKWNYRHADFAMKISGYVIFYNNAATVLDAVNSLRAQQPPLDEVFAVDDGSTDQSAAILEAAGVRVVRQPRNLGRGAARARAMQEAQGELVLCCDATNVLPTNFAHQARVWFEDEEVAAVYGLLRDSAPRGAVARWRARHLFRSDVCHALRHHVPLITYGTIIRASAVVAAGGYNVKWRHNEDNELGERIAAAGGDIVSDPRLKIINNTRNSLSQVLERYWRWNVDTKKPMSAVWYLRLVWYSVRTMAARDLRARDPLAACISLLTPYYQLWRQLRP